MKITTDMIRLWGSSHRETVAGIHAKFGRDSGFRAVRRFMFEEARFIAEIHGSAQAAELCYTIGDRLVSGLQHGDEMIPDGLNLGEAPETEPAAAGSPPDISGVLDQRIAEVGEWLTKNGGAATDVPTDLSDRIQYRRGYLAALRDARAAANSAA